MIWLWIFGPPLLILLLAYLRSRDTDITFDPPNGDLRLDERTTATYRDQHRRGGSRGWREADN